MVDSLRPTQVAQEGPPKHKCGDNRLLLRIMYRRRKRERFSLTNFQNPQSMEAIKTLSPNGWTKSKNTTQGGGRGP